MTRIGRGKYVLGNKKKYIPEIYPTLKNISNAIIKQFPFLEHCLWSSIFFNEFMLHQPGSSYTVIEVENVALESVFYFFKDKSFMVFLDPDKELLHRYSINKKNILIIKPLVTEAPVQQISGVWTTTIEKMLVDLFCDTVILDAQQGSEKDRILNEALTKYAVNINRIWRYADRRGKKNEVYNNIKELPAFDKSIDDTDNVIKNDR